MNLTFSRKRGFQSAFRQLQAATLTLVCILTAACGSGGSGRTSTNNGTGNTQAVLNSILVGGNSQSVPVNGSQQFTATGQYSDGSSKNLSAQAAWASSSPNVASVSGAGMATGVAAGTTTITASVGSVSGSKSLTITPILSAIIVTPANSSVVTNATQQFTATGTWSDGSSQDVSNQVTWSSSDNSIASIDSGGLLTSALAGSATVSATLGTVSGSTGITVTAPVLNSINVSPDQPTVPLGISQPFTATGLFNNNTSAVLSSVAWSSSDSTIVTIDNTGTATTVGVGTATITASSGSVSATTTLTVLPAALVSVSFNPSAPSLALGTSTQIQAIGLFTDGSTQVLSSVVWTSSDTSVSTVDNTGLVSTIAVGNVTISATVGSLTGSTSVTVTSAALSAITVAPSNASIAAGSTQQFTATGLFSDGSTQDVSSIATWISSDGTIATISNTGLADALATGTATITASSGSVSGAATLQVSAATLQSISVTPSSPTLAVGTEVQLTATGNYSDGSAQDLTSVVTWATNHGNIASVDGTGLVTARRVGSATITAALGTVSGLSALSVSGHTLQSIVVTPPNPTAAAGTKLQFKATAYYDDGTSQDITISAHWSTSSSNLATINSGQNGGGLATAKASGGVTITASLNGVSGTSVMTVN